MNKVIDKCSGCAHRNETICDIYYDPAAKWMNIGHCPMATHIKKELAPEPKKVRPHKQKKGKK